MGVQPVCLSAGELEDEWAGEPGKRLRERYRFAGASLGPIRTCRLVTTVDCRFACR